MAAAGVTDRPSRGSAFIAGGGTAGHVVPGIAIAQSLVDMGWPASKIHFVGSVRGVEAEMVPRAGFGLTTLAGRGINERRLNLANLRNAFDIIRGVLRGVALVARYKPAVVVSLGGYAALPASIGAVVRRVPVVIAEQNAVPSSTNRLLSRFARAAAVPFEGVDLRRATVTGNPVRPEVLTAAMNPGSRPWPADRLKVVAFGGSLGSLTINQAVWGAIAVLAERGGVFVYHVVGRRDWPQRERPDIAAEAYEQVEYDDDLASALASADLVVSRAGGSTVAELAVIGVASVLIPLPIAPHDHQRHNASALARAGAARVVDDGDFDADRLVAEIENVLGSGATTAADAARTVGHPDAAQRVAALVVSCAARLPDGVDATAFATPHTTAPQDTSDD